MRTLQTLALAAVALGLLIGAVVASRQSQQASAANPAPLPTGIQILAARPFVVDEPFVHEWRLEKPLVESGYLLALEVGPELARPRQTWEPVLYVGAETAERCAFSETGVLVVLVPAPLDGQGRVALDLTTAPIWFGGHELPERVDVTRIQAELAQARARGLGPAHPGAGAVLRFAADEAIRVRTREELEPYIEDWLAR